MFMKKLVLLFLLLALPCAARAEVLRIVTASDLHYLSPALVDDRNALLRIVSAADGKVTHYTPQIVHAFVDEMLGQAPDAIILSGDLTLNGGIESHRELISLLSPLRQAGIPVLVIPGNHDCTGKAYRFTAHGAQPVAGMTWEQFPEAYADFGYADALSRDEASFSYVYALSPTLRLLLLDVNTPDAPGGLRDETLRWAQEQLRAAAQAGAQVIGVSHQNLLVHYAGFAVGFQISNANRLAALYSQYGVKLHLSGHMHLQHIAQDGCTTEIATSSLAVYPHHYGMIALSDAEAAYAAHPLDVAAWARAQGIDDENLLNFKDYSQSFFDACNSSHDLLQIDALHISVQDKAAMLAYARALNRAVFAGVDPQTLDQSALALWQRHLPASFFSQYIQWLLDSVPTDMRQKTVPLR